MKEFTDSNEYQAGWRLNDIGEVARRVRRLGVPAVDVDYDNLTVRFHDPRINGLVILEIMPLRDDSAGWIWYADIAAPGWFSMGPLAVRRWVEVNARPRTVVRMYQRQIRFEMRSPRRKMNAERRRRGGIMG